MSDSTTLHATIIDRWTQQVAAHPEDVALHWRTKSYTFGELGELVDQMASWLRTHCCKSGDVVATTLPRSAEAIIAQLAIIHAGATHLAIDPRGAPGRTSAILRDAKPAYVLDYARWQLAMDDLWRPPQRHREQPRPRSGANANTVATPSSAAYLVYTSGSSGAPKGVLVEHRSLANLLLEHERHLFPLATQAAGRPRLRVAHAIALSFDAAWDPLLWMVGGHELYLLSDEVRADAALMDQAILDNALDVVEVTPGLAGQLVQRGLFHLSHAPSLLLTGGEAVGQGLWTELAAAPRTVAINLYGPSECTVFATWARVDRYPRPVIGHPIAGTMCQVVDAEGRPLPDGSVGELVLSGTCVARGYHDRAELTAERFSAVSDMEGVWRSYRTGDLVRRSADGALEFHGRADRQVKIRGHRIELGEIEATLLAHPDVDQAVVKLRDDAGSSDLVAYVVGPDDGVLPDLELKEFLADRLPQVMIPAVFLRAGELPLTSHGKVDFDALTLPPRSPAFTPPDPLRGELEARLGKAFCSVLKLDRIGRNDSFFDLGGHSLLAAVIAENLRRDGVACTLPDIMGNPRIADLAKELGALACRGAPAKETA
ncbi:non-ribosomal peptide synthetase [Amycolatopsis sp. EV170708-02-1]|uniref:non-ribosomal peptide synthetase n=1 Tax=Amycolatopsis sp. EV170708-02-1 TaxID=2919322 RepID=UPI001F0B8F0F|nr:non-ribosomal peptide synthetase [Amycolatopsis sp. EV170708-02-1]UMP06939.1 non-ribosomal peptide synthetase [Amycolatopsis sp. EV170708-02-1]